MKRVVGGIVLVVLMLPSLFGFGSASDETVVFSFIMVLCGSVLIYFGTRYIKRVKQISSFALQMLREDGKIDAGQLAHSIGLSEEDARVILAESQRKGIIPFKTEIV